MQSQKWAPEAFFDRVRRLGRALDRPTFPSQKRDWRLIAGDLRAFLRMAWRMNTRHPELNRHFWGTIYDCLRHNPRAIELVVTNIIIYLHLYPFSRFVVGEVDKFIERIDTGRYVDPAPMPVPAISEACAPKMLAAVA